MRMRDRDWTSETLVQRRTDGAKWIDGDSREKVLTKVKASTTTKKQNPKDEWN